MKKYTNTYKNNHISESNTEWVTAILEKDNLQLANAKRLTPYGKAEYGSFVRILLWAMRVYVVISFILIIVQLYISIKP